MAVSRPVDLVIEFLEAEKARGVTHVLLNEPARHGLREAFIRSRALQRPRSNAVREAKSSPPPAPATNTGVTVPTGSKEQQIAALREQASHWPPALALGTLRKTMVFSAGNLDARIMLVGEAPGYEEERQGEPFVGPAGQKLNDILKAMGLRRDEVYLSNIVKFRPATARQTTNNRPPSPAEIAACLPFIRAEVEIVRPECIIALGGTAAEGLLGIASPVGRLRESWHAFADIPCRVTYHPSFLLRSEHDLRIKRQVWEDLLAVMEKIGMTITERQRGFFLPKT